MRKYLAGLWILPLLAVVNLNAAGPSSSATVVEAAKTGDAKAVRVAIAQGNVNMSEADGTTALHWAVRRGDMDSVDLLLKELPPGCRAGENDNAFVGGFRLWQKTGYRKPNRS